jgi:predicted nucleic acid-binding Zn ribbon protein
VSGREKPVRLGDALQKYLRDAGLEERIEEAATLPEWEERVGPAIAGVTEPVRVSDGTLIVAVRTSAWLMELRLMEREILRRLNEGREKGRLRGIRFVMSGSDATPEEASPPRRRGGRKRGRGGS